MSRFVTCWRGVGAAGVLAGVLLFTSLQAAPVSNDPDAKAKMETPAEKIRKALDKNVTIKSNNQPLSQAIAQFREQGKINIFLDRAALGNYGLTEEIPVSVELDNVKMRTGLRTMLAQYNLSYAIVGNMLIVTTEDMAIHRQMQQRVSVDYKDVPLRTALDQLARETAINLIVDKASKEGQKAISLQLEDVPLELTVRLMAEMADLNIVRVDNVIIVTDGARAEKLRAELGSATTGSGRMRPNSPPFGNTQEMFDRFGGGRGALRGDDRGPRTAPVRKTVPQPPPEAPPPAPAPVAK